MGRSNSVNSNLLRVVRLVKSNPGLTSNQIYNLVPFNFTLKSLRILLSQARQLNYLTPYKKGRDYFWYIKEKECQQEPTTVINEEVTLNDTL
jgi:hypothetical protein